MSKVYKYKNEEYNSFLQGIEDEYVANGYSPQYGNAKALQFRNAFSYFHGNFYENGRNHAKQSMRYGK